MISLVFAIGKSEDDDVFDAGGREKIIGGF